ncbi:unnamed protein product [Absidia cylindrospora]
MDDFRPRLHKKKAFPNAQGNGRYLSFWPGEKFLLRFFFCDMTIGHVSTELVSFIIQCVDQRDLYACALINRACHVITTPCLWRTLHDKNIGTFDYTTLGHHVRHGQFYDLDNTTFLLIMQHCPRLQTLHVDSARYIKDTSLQQLPRHCPQLTSLHLCRTPITHLTIKALRLHCPHLGHLDLDKCTNLDWDVLPTLAGCPHLTTLSIHAHDASTNQTTTMTNALHSMHQLRGLTLIGMPVALTHRLVTRACWPRLTHLCLDPCHTLTDTDVIRFLQTHRTLVSLEFRRNGWLGDATLEAIGLYLPDLEVLGLSYGRPHMTVLAMRRLVCQCRSLQRVYFAGAPAEAFPKRPATAFWISDNENACFNWIKTLFTKFNMEPRD